MNQKITYEMFDKFYKERIDKFEIVGFKEHESASLTITDKSVRFPSHDENDADQDVGRIYVDFEDLDELIMALIYVRQQVERRYESKVADITIEM